MYNHMFHCISQSSVRDIYVHNTVYQHLKKNFSICLVGGNSDTIIFKLEANFLSSV